MTVQELAKNFKVNRFVVYRIIYKLEDLGNYSFVRKRGKVELGKEDVEVIKKELENLGYNALE